ncbi:hypothetical protein [Blautia sp. MSJ-9]|uniref:hypothetical protein n=1 Tax=Blautia sp. MSJ-9 TaxID=2841511 RepID=UPI001C10CB5A|nr:hypothetical protein [Blautia sp. MSJ-9]MBU5680102.1 hypothetical protein [Blautia sp. MSJ-9]
MGEMMKELSFSIDGETITKMAREWFYEGEKSFEKIMEFLFSCMSGTDTPEAQLRRYAEDILIGRAALKGSTEDETYHLEIYGPGEEEKLPRNMDIWQESTKKRKIKKELEKMAQRWNVAMQYIPEETQRRIREELGEETEEDRQQRSVDSYVKRMTDKTEHTTPDYGWLEPNGTFHAVEWGEHQSWAQSYLDENYPEQAEDKEIDMQVKCNNLGLIGAGDWLVERGWILLHNPTHGIAYPLVNPVKKPTKAQKEFLFDYYIERNCEKEASAVWSDSFGSFSF